MILSFYNTKKVSQIYILNVNSGKIIVIILIILNYARKTKSSEKALSIPEDLVFVISFFHHVYFVYFNIISRMIYYPGFCQSGALLSLLFEILCFGFIAPLRQKSGNCRILCLYRLYTEQARLE